ncbi:MAG TPA: hypothetical protein VHV78_08380 [Gemmatimonadaceae bacterium]|jgi:hypothetical protein|nr:hypothetical protein [Gemmatimonadaceae bacterium]
MPRTDRRRVAVRLACAALAACAAVASSAPTAAAQGGVLLQGIADGELWSTNRTSNLLTRNDGRLGEVGRLQLWGAYEPFKGIVVYAQVRAEGGSASVDTAQGRVYSEQFGVRYAGSQAFGVDAGRLTPVVGTFAARRLSTRNPLIGAPDGYSLIYPLGVEVSGEVPHFDYRAAIVSLPIYHEVYVPDPTARPRPAIGAGFTPITGLRIGGSFTVGSYLNGDYSGAALFGKPWSSYDQRVLALDFAYAVGYLETHAEYARGSYDVPGLATSVAGPTYYGEAKYTFSPRFFAAVRAERNDYPFIRFLGTTWVAKLTDFVNGEAGVGYRLSASTLLKVSWRGDRWWIAPGTPGFLGTGGHALAFQWSQSFDALSWFQRAQ